MNTRTIAVPATLDLKRTVSGSKAPVMLGPSSSWWSTRTPDGTGTLHLERASDTTVLAEAWGEGAQWLLEQAPRLLGSDDDVSDFRPGGVVRELWRRRPFLLSRTDRAWDAMVGAVFGQKVQVANAKASRRQLARTFGEPAPGPRRGWILPGPERVAAMGYHDFHPLGVERKRAETLIRAAMTMKRLEHLTSQTPAQVRARLEHIRGVGPWTTALVTATAMGDPDAVPVGDFHLKNTVSWHLAGEPRGTDERMLELLAPYEGHRWRVLRLLKSAGPAPKYGPKLSLTGDGLHLSERRASGNETN